MTLVVGLCVAAVAVWAASVPGGTMQARPLLGVADTSPFELRGSGFEPGERVQILLALNGRQHARSTVANQAGVFRVSFPVSAGACGRFTVFAHGSRGSRARVLPRRVLPDCVSPSARGGHT
jgi:hypothetical protein